MTTTWGSFDVGFVRRVAVTAAFAVGLSAGVLGVQAIPAGAACAGSPGIEDVDRAVEAGAPVFVGTVVSTTNGANWATFAVEEVWAGNVPDEVEVRSGPQHDLGGGRFVAMGETRAFTLGTRYLVTPNVSVDGSDPFGTGVPGEFTDNGCSATVVWNDSLAPQRPADARVISRDGPIEIIGAIPGPFGPDPDDGPPWPWIGAISIFIVIVGAGGILAWRAGAKTDPVGDGEIEDLIEEDRHRAGLE